MFSVPSFVCNVEPKPKIFCRFGFTAIKLRNENLIIPESMTQDFGCIVVLEIQAHSRLRNCFSGAAVQSKGKSDSSK